VDYPALADFPTHDFPLQGPASPKGGGLHRLDIPSPEGMDVIMSARAVHGAEARLTDPHFNLGASVALTPSVTLIKRALESPP